MSDREKIKHYLQMMVSEFINDKHDEVAIDILADIMVDILLEVINEELHKRYPKASIICYELWN